MPPHPRNTPRHSRGSGHPARLKTSPNTHPLQLITIFRLAATRMRSAYPKHHPKIPTHPRKPPVIPANRGGRRESRPTPYATTVSITHNHQKPKQHPKTSNIKHEKHLPRTLTKPPSRSIEKNPSTAPRRSRGSHHPETPGPTPCFRPNHLIRLQLQSQFNNLS